LIVFTLGYEGKSILELLDLLKENEITLLVDVRENPFSRKKGFSGRELEYYLASCSIGYLHLKELGAPPAMRQKVRREGDYHQFFREYRRHLADQSHMLQEVAEKFSHEVICLLCYEKNPDYCHRTVVAQELSRLFTREISITHLC